MKTIRFKFKLIIFLVCAILVIVLIMFSPLFNFEYVTVSGNFQIETDEILERAGLDDYTNFFLFNTSRARRNILENLYIEQVVINRTFPDTVEIIVQERFLSGFIEHLEGMFLYIDENGRVLDVRSYRAEDLPIITGLRFTRFQLGQTLEVDNPDAFSTVVTYSRLLNRHGLVDIVTQLDVSNHNNARLRLYDIEVYLGDTVNAHHKILTLREIVTVWPMIQEIRGILDLRGSEYIFRKIT